jgi:hypothetical protein
MGQGEKIRSWPVGIGGFGLDGLGLGFSFSLLLNNFLKF